MSNTLNLLIKENRYEISLCNGEAVNLNLMRTQGYTPTNIKGDIKYQNNMFGESIVLSTSDFLNLSSLVKCSY